MNLPSAYRLALDLMANTNNGFLTTIDESGQPQTRAMFNLRNQALFPRLANIWDTHDQDFLIYFTTNTSSKKIHQLKSNPRAAVYYCQPDDWRGLNLSGTLQMVADLSIKEALWHDEWALYYPQGFTDPDYAVLAFRPQSARYYHQLTDTSWNFPITEGLPK